MNSIRGWEEKTLDKADIKIRFADLRDAEELRNIYAPYVENTAITFEYTVPTRQEFEDRMRQIQTKYPYLVARMGEEIVGYAYADSFKDRAAYDWAVETSIYVKMDKKALGIGRRLYEVLEKILALQNILNLNACIAYSEEENEYLTLDSVRFHERMGYQMVGKFHQCGYKGNRWYDMVWMEKHIGDHVNIQENIKPVHEIMGQANSAYLDE